MANLSGLGRVEFVVVQHLQHTWDRACGEGLDPHLAVAREERVFDLIAALDPTSSGRYLQWLSHWRRRQWDHTGLQALRDTRALSRLASGLAHFDEIRRFLPPDRRDVNRYLTADELLNAWIAIPEAGRRQLRRHRKKEAVAGSDILFHQADWKLVRLRTRQAAQWWGLGTRWCTAARFDNKFDTYALKGDLLVLVTPVDRFQLCCGTGEFRDAEDASADLAVALAGVPRVLVEVLSAQVLPNQAIVSQILAL